jgi:hypothetical protein
MDDDAVLTLRIETKDPSIIPFDTVAELFNHFNRLIAALGKEIAPKTPVTWGLTQLTLGSVNMEARPIPGNLVTEQMGRRIVQAADEAIAYAHAGDLAAMPFSPAVREELAAMLEKLNDAAPAFEIGSPGKRVRLTKFQLHTTGHRSISWGTVSGIADGIDQHAGLEFTLYDDVFDNGIHCQLREGVSPLGLRDLFGKRVEVEGLISANPDTGLIKSVAQIEEITIIDTPDADYRAAEGIWRDWESTPDERLAALRRVRHGE